MSQISVNHLTFYYDGSYDHIFEDVSFQIDTDWKLGFIARNGRGKTTFLRLLQGRYEYKGIISASVEFDYFPFEVTDPTKAVLDVIEEAEPEYEFWKVCRELTLLQMDTDIFDRPFSTLSNGEQVKVMLAVLFSKEHHFLLIDEPTNHLDMETRQLVSQYLNRKKGFLLVSHDRTFLDSCIDHVLVINKADIEVQQGNFASWQENKRRQDEFEIAENNRIVKDVRRLTKASRQAGEWADQVESSKIGHKFMKEQKSFDNRDYVGEKSRRMQMRRKNLEKRRTRELEEKASLLKNIETEEELKIIPLVHHKDILISMKDVGISYGSRKIVSDFELEIRNGEKVILGGRNGCGKSSIISAVMGEAANRKEPGMELSGQIVIAGGLKISYVKQNASDLCGSISDYAKSYGIDETLFRTLLRKLDFSRVQFEKRMEEYSGGQKKKVLIARSLCEQAHLYIWDEPLNFIDVFSRMQIETLIRKYNPTLLMVEHDRSFIEETGARVVAL